MGASHVMPSPDATRDYVDTLLRDYELFKKTGSRYPEPQTRITKRRDYMARRFSTAPAGGFSGALGMGSVRKKSLLGA